MYTTVLSAKSTVKKNYYTVFARIDRKTGIAEIDELSYRSLKRNLVKWEFDAEELRALNVHKIVYVKRGV